MPIAAIVTFFQFLKNWTAIMNFVFVLATLIFGFASAAWSQETYNRSTGACAADSIGTVYCAGPFGGAIKDGIGTVYCGIGQCARDSIDTVYCSSVMGGGAAVDSIGTVYCTGGCTRASRCNRGER